MNEIKFYDIEVRAGKNGFKLIGITEFADGTFEERDLETGIASEREAKELMGSYLGDIAEKAEKAAGWDPNP